MFRWTAVLLMVCCLAACGNDDDPTGADTSVPVERDDPAVAAGCSLATAVVTDVLGYRVELDETEDSGAEGCTYVATDQSLHPGATVLVTRALASAVAFDDIVRRLDAEVAPTEAIDGDDVRGAQRGYVVVFGVAVQVGVVGQERLLTVTVAESGLDPEVGRDRALELAEQALAAEK